MDPAREALRHEIFLDIAEDLSGLATCDRAHVGALIVKDGRCVSWGYNGAPPGLPHCSENMHGWLNSPEHVSTFGMESEVHFLNRVGCRNVTHAEANALAFAARQGISTDGGTLYVTMSPCDTCAKLLIAAGIVKVYFQERYRDDSGIVTLGKAGIESIDMSHM